MIGKVFFTGDRHTDRHTQTHTLPQIWGDVKKTSPMKGEVFFTGDRQTDRQTDGHRDSMTESAQWADSVKTSILFDVFPNLYQVLSKCPQKCKYLIEDDLKPL